MAGDNETEYVEVDGKCLCGNNRYHAAGETFGIIHCYCQRCQKHTGSTFASFIIFAAGRLTWSGGVPNLGLYKHDISTRAFCQQCGSSLPTPHSDETVLGNVLAGNILDMKPPREEWHLFTTSRCPWTEIPDDAQQWETVAEEHKAQDPKLANLSRYLEKDSITGSCLCGEVSFKASTPIGMMNCHCTRCRLSRSSAHATNLFVNAEDFEWRSGSEKVSHYKLPNAERFGSAFCLDCGSLVPRVSSQRVNIPAGCLDSDPGIVPRGHIHTGSMAHWYSIADELRQWKEGPG